MNETISSNALNIIDQYFTLSLGGKEVACPYFKNKYKKRMGLRVYLGKGTPEEICEEVELLAMHKKISLENLSVDQIREFMQQHDIGIDCSGLISQILFSTNPELIKKMFIVSPYANPIRFFVSKIRRIENISVKVLTSARNSTRILTINDIRPGDMVRTWGGNHIFYITSVEQNNQNNVQSLEYVHSTLYYGKGNGMRRSKIHITDPNHPLEKQEWLETDTETGHNFTLEGYINDLNDSGVFRLK